MKPGDEVWGVRFQYGHGEVGRAIVKKITPKQVHLEGTGTSAFGYRRVVGPEECYPTKRAALVVLRDKMTIEVEAAYSRAKRLRDQQGEIIRQIGLEPIP